MRVLIDTNVILDFLLSRKPHVKEAKQIFSLISHDVIKGYTTASSVTDIYYITSKILNDNAAREAVKQLLKIIGVVTVTGEDCTNALDLPITDYEDAVVAVCADKERFDYIVTNDKVFLQVTANQVLIVSPTEFIRKILEAK